MAAACSSRWTCGVPIRGHQACILLCVLLVEADGMAVSGIAVGRGGFGPCTFSQTTVDFAGEGKGDTSLSLCKIEDQKRLVRSRDVLS